MGWVMYMGSNASLVSITPNIRSRIIKDCTTVSGFSEPCDHQNLVLIVERPTLHLCYWNSISDACHLAPNFTLNNDCDINVKCRYIFFGQQAARVQGPSRCKLAWVPLLHWNEKWWKRLLLLMVMIMTKDVIQPAEIQYSQFKTCRCSCCFGQFGDLQISNKGNTHVWAYPIHVPRHCTQFYHNFRGHHVSHIPQKNQNFFSSFLPLRILTIKCIGFQFSGARHQYVGTLSCSWLLLAYWLTYMCEQNVAKWPP